MSEMMEQFWSKVATGEPNSLRAGDGLMSEEPMVERVARAIWFEYATPPYEWDTINPATRDRHRDIARIAIAAIREPTEAMVEAGDAVDVATDQYCADAGAHWRAMIDEAMK